MSAANFFGAKDNYSASGPDGAVKSSHSPHIYDKPILDIHLGKTDNSLHNLGIDDVDRNSLQSGSADIMSKNQTEKTTTKPKHKSKNQLTTLFDYTRMENLFKIIKEINQSSSLAQALTPIMQGITSVVNSSNASFFVFQKNLLTEKDKKNLTI